MDRIRFGRFGKVVDGAKLHCRHGSGDVAVTPVSTTAARIGARLMQGIDDVETRSIRQTKIDDGEFRRVATHLGTASATDSATRTAKPRTSIARASRGTKRPVVVDYEEASAVRWMLDP